MATLPLASVAIDLNCAVEEFAHLLTYVLGEHVMISVACDAPASGR